MSGLPPLSEPLRARARGRSTARPSPARAQIGPVFREAGRLPRCRLDTDIPFDIGREPPDGPWIAQLVGRVGLAGFARAADRGAADGRALRRARRLHPRGDGPEFAEAGPRAAVETAAVETVAAQSPTLTSNLGPEEEGGVATPSILRQIAVSAGDTEAREGWGWHEQASWRSVFDAIAVLAIGPERIDATRSLADEVVAPANGFDHGRVRADADGCALGEDGEAVEVEGPRATTFDAAVQGQGGGREDAGWLGCARWARATGARRTPPPATARRASRSRGP